MGIVASVQSYDLNIPAGGAQNIDVAGTRVQFLSADDPFAQIELRPNYAQGNISLRPGQGFQFDEQVTRWVVFNRGQVPLKGLLLIGSGNFFDQRIAGTVDVIDGGKARTLGNNSFVANGGANATAAQYSVAQLWNPAGSGRKVIVESVQLVSTGTPVAGQILLQSALLSGGPVLNMLGQSKLSGGAASAAGVYGLNTASVVPQVPMMVLTAQAYATPVVKPVEPFILLPGWGMTVWGLAQNATMGVNFEWYEEVA